MNLKELKRFLDGDIELAALRSEYEKEVGEYEAALKKRGSSAAVVVANDDFSRPLKSEDLRKLCNCYLDGEISEVELDYLANVLEMSDSFEPASSDVSDALFRLSSPEINGALTPASVAEIAHEALKVPHEGQKVRGEA